MTAAHPQPTTQTTKTCTKCGTTRPHSDFYRSRNLPDGRHPWCKSCARAASRAHREANPENIKARRARYAAENREGIRASDAAYYAANKARINAKRKTYAAEYRAANPHVKWAHKYRKRAEKYGLPIVCDTFTRDDVITYWGTDKCIYCDGPFQQIDHLIPVIEGGTHTLHNVAPCCKPCNDINSGPAIIRRRRAEEPR